MRLKRLETYGFKSFADRLSFDFEQGITAIVGPNGCGKSNVVDSIKWVVGEQSAKALRGAEMSDVIFNGCATRRPMPFAEVTLTLERPDGIDAGELALTRRLTRDGQSSYYLNGKPARLRDIRELLMGTGIGTSAYSVIEQGRIGFILQSSVKDRRAILEEASGISRYKARRKVTERRLEKVDENLVRIGQVLAEVERRLRTVRKQAETALHWQELSTRLRDLRVAFALEDHARIAAELDTLQRGIAELSDAESHVAARLGELQASLGQADAQLLELDEAIRQAEASRGETRSRRDVANQAATTAGHRLVEVDQQEVEDRRALEQLEGRSAALAQERADVTDALAGELGGQGDNRLSGLYSERRADLDALIAEIDALVAAAEDRRAKEIECLRELSRIEAEQGRLASSRQSLLDRRGRLEERARGHQNALDGARSQEEAARATVTLAEQGSSAAHASLDGLIRQREEAQAEGSQLENQLNDVRHEEGRAEVRLRLLSEYEQKLEGVFGGVRDVLRAMDRLPGICGMVADLFRVGREHELAIETALGARAQNIVAETVEGAKGAIDFLKRERRGRATFLPLDDLRGRGRLDRQLLREAGVIGLASELIEHERRYAPVFDHLLGGVLVCETLDHAIALRRSRRPDLLLVTLDGDLVNPGGAMTGGRQQGKDAGGLVSRKNEIHRLEGQLTELATQRTAVGSARDEVKRRAFDLAVAVEEQRRRIQTEERALGDAKAQLMKAERDRSHIEEFSASFGSELEEIATELSRLDADVADLAGQGEWFQALRARMETELAERSQTLSERGQRRERLQEEVNTLRVDLATSEERREALRNHLGRLERQQQELADERAERERRLAAQDERRQALIAERAQAQADHVAAGAEFDRLSAQLEELGRRRDGLRNSTEEERQEARALDTRSRGLERERTEQERRAGELEIRRQTLRERIREDYQIELEEAAAHWQRPADLDLPTLRRELSATERELSALGPVNLAAIDELAEVEARETFLSTQHADLSAARNQLVEIIEHLNTTSRRKFEKTYREVRRNFQDLFRKLYGGGKADLILQLDPDSKDVLEAGLEIIAQPPGKQPKSITLLSGGETALTAIALLFAVYMTKPSPFCILDEVDAPLDESNTDVYCAMVREFCDRSQFLVITHNKRTMQFADAIYGITQQERGISAKISVKLEDVVTAGDQVATVMGAGPFSD